MPLITLLRSWIFVFSLIWCAICSAFAHDINVVGLFPNKAVLVINGNQPKTYSTGATVAAGVRLVAVDQTSATFNINGAKEQIPLGAHSNPVRSDRRATVTVHADPRGHYLVDGQINGRSVSMLLDTGATSVALPASEAKRLGVDYWNAPVRHVRTANGVASAYAVKLERIRVGDIEFMHIDAMVLETGLSSILVGMSFLSRTEMRHDGSVMTLTKRF